MTTSTGRWTGSTSGTPQSQRRVETGSEPAVHPRGDLRASGQRLALQPGQGDGGAPKEGVHRTLEARKEFYLYYYFPDNRPGTPST